MAPGVPMAGKIPLVPGPNWVNVSGTAVKDRFTQEANQARCWLLTPAPAVVRQTPSAFHDAPSKTSGGRGTVFFCFLVNVVAAGNKSRAEAHRARGGSEKTNIGGRDRDAEGVDGKFTKTARGQRFHLTIAEEFGMNTATRECAHPRNRYNPILSGLGAFIVRRIRGLPDSMCRADVFDPTTNLRRPQRTGGEKWYIFSC